MRISITVLVTAILILAAGSAQACKDQQAQNEEDASLGLQTAKRVVRAQQVADHTPARALGWSSWMVQKYKKSAQYQSEQKKSVRN